MIKTDSNTNLPSCMLKTVTYFEFMQKWVQKNKIWVVQEQSPVSWQF